MLKKIIYLFIIFVSFYSCTPDEEPINNIDKFYGTWGCQEKSKLTGPSSYTVKILADETKKYDLKISNFYMYGFEDFAGADVSENSITIPRQILCNNIIQGNGYIDNAGTTINWEYTIDDGSGKVDSCTAIYTKK